MERDLGEWHPVRLQGCGRESDHGVGRGRGRPHHRPGQRHEESPGVQVQTIPWPEIRHAGIQTAEVMI